MANNPDNGRRIQTALEMMRQAPLAIEPETMEVFCFCANNDEPYTLHFTQQPNGLFRLKESIKVIRDSRNTARTYGRVPAQANLNIELFERLDFPCAWCGNGELNYCRKDCGALVCGGRSVGNRFNCRKSCGASWVGVPLDAVPAQAGSPGRQPIVSPASVRQPPKTAVVSTSLRLGGGTDLAKRNNQ
jgi:hypothetical protein